MHREAILQVLDDERAERARKQEEERQERELQQDQTRAERVATKLNLSVGQKQILADYYTTERTKREEMRIAMRDSDGSVEPREAFRAAQEWRTNELGRLFGTDLGAQITEAESQRDRRDVQQVRRGGQRPSGGPQGLGGG
jgi:hypothetical protein